MSRNFASKSASPATVFVIGLTIVLNGCCGGSRCCRSVSAPCLDVPVACSHLEADTERVPSSTALDSCWWQIFEDPDLNLLIEQVKDQNFSLQASCQRIQEARHLRNIVASRLLPACPGMSSKLPADLCSADAQICERMHDYNFSLNSLIAETATIYIQIRALDERIELARRNVQLQLESLEVAQKKLNEGRSTRLEVAQAESNLAATQSAIPQLELGRRKYLNALCVLVGVPPGEVPCLSDRTGRIPVIPDEVLVGVPGDLLCQRDDLCAAATRLKSVICCSSQNCCLSNLFPERVREKACVKSAIAKQLLADYRNKVLLAQREVEDGIAEFIKKAEQLNFDQQAALSDEESAQLAMAAYNEGSIDLSRVLNLQSKVVLAQDQVVETRREIALALIKTYRAIGSGWSCQCVSDSPCEYPVDIETETDPIHDPTELPQP